MLAVGSRAKWNWRLYKITESQQYSVQRKSERGDVNKAACEFLHVLSCLSIIAMIFGLPSFVRLSVRFWNLAERICFHSVTEASVKLDAKVET